MAPLIISDEFELGEQIEFCIQNFGPSCDLNHLDVSNIKNFSALFFGMNFNGNISRWNVSNATNMSGMFANSTFNGEIGSWDVSRVRYMNDLFYNCPFNGDISRWRPLSLTHTSCMFSESYFNQELNDWEIDLTRLHDYRGMFYRSRFDKSLTQWSGEHIRFASLFLDDFHLYQAKRQTILERTKLRTLCDAPQAKSQQKTL